MQFLAAQRVRTAGLGRHMSVVNRAMRRNLSLWHPPKFENEKPVRSLYFGCLWSLYTDNIHQLNYAKGSPERAELTQSLKKLKSEIPFNIPIQINGAAVSIITLIQRMTC